MTGRTTRIVAGPQGAMRVVRTCDVTVVTGPDAGRSGRIERPSFRVGSHPTNDLVLSDPTVSQQHLEITVGPDGFRVLDLGSSNGTYWGSARLEALSVIEPTTLRLGETTLELAPTELEASVPSSPHPSFGRVLGRSVLMRELFAQLETVAQSDCSVLLEGETGVGKELVAESLHEASPRRDGPFVVVDCAALAGDVVESELFGHVAGAYTGALADRAGLLEAAHGGTLFLDEVGELPLPLQVKLLGALERRVVRRIGETTPRAIDLRVVAATNRNLAAEVNAKRFRADLFYRLAVVRLVVPPLRDRLDDVPLLVQAILRDLRATYGDVIPTELSAIAMARLAAQPWPGNVRELRNTVERVAHAALESEVAIAPYFDFRAQALAEFEAGYFRTLVQRHGPDSRKIAEAAQIERRSAQRFLKRYGLTRRDGRDHD